MQDSAAFVSSEPCCRFVPAQRQGCSVEQAQSRLLASTPVKCWGVQCRSTAARQLLKATLQAGPVLVCVKGQGEHMPALQHITCTDNSEDLMHTL